MCRLFFHPDERVEPVGIDQPLSPGEILSIAGGIEVIHVPGHCAGQVALLWCTGGMLFAGDVCMNLMASRIPSASKIWMRVARASANWPAFHSKLLGLATASLSPAMRRASSATNGAMNHAARQ